MLTHTYIHTNNTQTHTRMYTTYLQRVWSRQKRQSPTSQHSPKQPTAHEQDSSNVNKPPITLTASPTRRLSQHTGTDDARFNLKLPPLTIILAVQQVYTRHPPSRPPPVCQLAPHLVAVLISFHPVVAQRGLLKGTLVGLSTWASDHEWTAPLTGASSKEIGSQPCGRKAEERGEVTKVARTGSDSAGRTDTLTHHSSSLCRGFLKISEESDW